MKQVTVTGRMILSLLCLILAVGAAAGQRTGSLSPITVALDIAASLDKDSYDFADATKDIALNYWRRGDAAAAFAQVERIPAERRTELLLTFAVDAGRRKQTKLADLALARALEIFTVDEESRDGSWLRDFVAAAIDANNLEMAARFTDLMEEGTLRRALSLMSIATARAKRSEKKEAISLVEQSLKQIDLFDEYELKERNHLLATAAIIMTRLGEKDRASALANKASDLLALEANPDWRDQAETISALAQIGELSRARSMVEDGQGSDQSKGLIMLAHIYQGNGDEAAALSLLNRALEVARSTHDDSYSLAMALDPIVSAYVKFDRPDEAMDVLRRIDDTYYVTKLAIEVAGSYKAKERTRDAIAAIDIAFARVRQVVSEKSEDIPNSASSSKAQDKSRALLQLSEQYIELNAPSLAEAAAAEIDQPQYRSSALAKVAVAYAKAGENLKAKALLAGAFKVSSTAASYSHDEWAETTLFEIAEGYAEVGLKQEAANTVLRLLRELLNDNHCCQAPVSELMELGALVEDKGIVLNKESQLVLNQLARKFEKDN